MTWRWRGISGRPCLDFVHGAAHHVRVLVQRGELRGVRRVAGRGGASAAGGWDEPAAFEAAAHRSARSYGKEESMAL
jgi:hypothetical protein